MIGSFVIATALVSLWTSRPISRMILLLDDIRQEII